MKNKKKWIIFIVIAIGLFLVGFTSSNRRVSTTQVSPKTTTALPSYSTQRNSYYDQLIQEANRGKKDAADFFNSAYKKGMSDIDIAYYFNFSCNNDPSPISDQERMSATFIYQDMPIEISGETFSTYPENFDDWLKSYNDRKDYKTNPFKGDNLTTSNWVKEFEYSQWQQKCNDYELFLIRKKNGYFNHLTSAPVPRPTQDASGMLQTNFPIGQSATTK